MFPAASSILEQDVITEECLKRLIKDDLQMTRLPRNLDTFYFFFSIYKKWGMQNTETCCKAWKKGKLYFSVREVISSNAIKFKLNWGNGPVEHKLISLGNKKWLW